MIPEKLDYVLLCNDCHIHLTSWEESIKKQGVSNKVFAFDSPADLIHFLKNKGYPGNSGLWILDRYYFGQEMSPLDLKEIRKLKRKSDKICGSSVTNEAWDCDLLNFRVSPSLVGLTQALT